MAGDYLEMGFRMAAALVAGGLIGLERSHRGRPAGFRTHALVCLSSTLLMLVTAYESHWFPRDSAARVIIDPTRMAQGIMTGIGFLGAGAIIKDGLSVRGLTTAASIWITAAIGILTGVGFYFAALVGTVLTLGTLSTFRWIEARLPTETYSLFMVRFARDAAMAEPALRSLVQAHGFSLLQPQLPAARRRRPARVPHGAAHDGRRQRALPRREAEGRSRGPGLSHRADE